MTTRLEIVEVEDYVPITPEKYLVTRRGKFTFSDGTVVRAYVAQCDNGEKHYCFDDGCFDYHQRLIKNFLLGHD